MYCVAVIFWLQLKQTNPRHRGQRPGLQSAVVVVVVAVSGVRFTERPVNLAGRNLLDPLHPHLYR